MLENERDTSILKHIIDYCNQIQATITRFGDSNEVFFTDFVYQNAVALCILQIGELVGILSDEFKADHTQIPWRQIRAVRNIVAHHYGIVDASTLWEIIHKDISDLKDFCESCFDPSI